MPDTSASGKQYLDPSSILRRLKIHPKMAVGDFGTGGGAYFALQAGIMVGADGVIWAIDVYKPALSACLSKAKLIGLQNIKTVWSNLEVYGGARTIGNDTLDAGLLVNVLHQTKKHREILRECSRMLKPGARLLVIDWELTGFQFGPDKKALVPPEEVEQVGRELGLQLTDSFQPSRYHYARIFEKVVGRRAESRK